MTHKAAAAIELLFANISPRQRAELDAFRMGEIMITPPVWEAIRDALTIKYKLVYIDGEQWRIKEARSMQDAKNAIDQARVMGSIGCDWSENGVTVARVERVKK